MKCIQPLAQDFVKLYESPDPQKVFAYSPGLAQLGERLFATSDLGGPGVIDMEGPKWQRGESGHAWQGRVYSSDDRGATWTQRMQFPFMHARPFVAGKSIYVLGQAGDLNVIRSDDNGETWTEPAKLTDGQRWHQAPCNVWHAHGCVYLVMEHRVTQEVSGWNICENAPVLMRGREDADLTKRENWTFASELSFREAVDEKALYGFGVPFYEGARDGGVPIALGRYYAPMGWLETNVVQISDANHYWHDPSGRTFHLWMRAHTGGSGYACILKVVEEGDVPGTGEMRTQVEKVPSGRDILYVPCPGGQMKFHVLFDEETKLFWLLSTQATDGMTRAEQLPKDRYNLPNNERRRLQLHFSKNMMDWCFAGLVAAGDGDGQSRHYASMLIDGSDLYVLSRSGDEKAKSAHDGNFISFHTIKNFRDLVY